MHQEDDHHHQKVLNVEKALENYDNEVEFYVMQLKQGLSAFVKGGAVDKMVESYRKFNWHIVESKEWKDFERDIHSLKGRCRYMGLDQLGERFEKLQFAVRDAHFISVAMLLEKSLQAVKPAQVAVLEYLKEPLDNLYVYQPNELCEFYQKIYNNQVRSELKVYVQQPSLQESQKLAKYLVIERDPGLNCDWADEPQDDPKDIKCQIF